MPDALDRFLLVTLLSIAAPLLLPAEQASGDSATAAEQLKAALRDQTIIQSSAWLDTEWDQFNGGAKELTWTLGVLWGWHVRDQQDWALRFKLPVVYQRSGEASGLADIGGLGNIGVATGTAFRLSNTWRTGGGMELHADTASNPALGDNVWRLHSSWTVAHDVTNWLTLGPTAEYSHSIAEDHGAEPQRYLELSLPATIILPYNWSIGMRYKTKIDFDKVTAGLTQQIWVWPNASQLFRLSSVPRWKRRSTVAIRSFSSISPRPIISADDERQTILDFSISHSTCKPILDAFVRFGSTHSS
jgi:hypothetical protein